MMISKFATSIGWCFIAASVVMFVSYNQYFLIPFLIGVTITFISRIIKCCEKEKS